MQHGHGCEISILVYILLLRESYGYRRTAVVHLIPCARCFIFSLMSAEHVSNRESCESGLCVNCSHLKRPALGQLKVDALSPFFS
jgi:hypothetical protein